MEPEVGCSAGLIQLIILQIFDSLFMFLTGSW